MSYRYAAQRTETVSAYCPICRVKTIEMVRTPYDKRWMITDRQLACSNAHADEYIRRCEAQFAQENEL